MRARWGSLLAAVLLGASGSTPTPKNPATPTATATTRDAPATISASKGDDGRTIEARVGDSVVLTLEENLSAGYRWDTVIGADPAVMKLTANNATPNNGAPSGAPVAGQPGTHDWTLRAVGPGTTSLRLEYHRPWETNPPAETFTLVVHVASAIASRPPA